MDVKRKEPLSIWWRMVNSLHIICCFLPCLINSTPRFSVVKWLLKACPIF